MVTCALVVGLSILVPWLPLPGLWEGLWVVSPLPGLWACFIWLVCHLAYVGFVSGRCPFSYIYRGGAVRFSFSLWALVSCILLDCLCGFALLVINS